MPLKPETLEELPDLAMSAGDLALVLSGRKTLHYATAEKPLKRGLVMLHGFTVEGHPVAFPVWLTDTRTVDGDTRLQREQLRECGRVVLPENTETKPKKTKKEFGGRTGMKLQHYLRSNRLPLAADIFTEADRFLPPTQYRAQEIAGDAGTVQEIRLQRVALGDPLSREMLQQAADSMQQAATTLEPELRAAHATVRKTRNVKHQIGYTTDASMQQAIWFLRSQKQGRIEKSVKTLHHAGLDLDRILNTPDALLPRVHNDALADGIGQNQLLGGASESISLGRALLLFSGASKYVLTREPLVYAKETGKNYPEPVTMRLQALGPASKSGHRNHAVEMPMQVDVAETDQRMSGGITDEQAQRYGYSGRKALLRELGIKKSENVPIYITPVQGLARDLPIDQDRLGSYWNRIMDGLHDVLINGKNGARSKRTGLLKTDKNLEPSVREALAFIATLPKDQQQEIFTSVARYWAMDEASRAQWLSHAGEALKEAGADGTTLSHHQLPADVAALKRIEARLAPLEEPQTTTPTTEQPPAPKRRESSPKTPAAGTEESLPHRGDNWSAPQKAWKALQPARAPLFDSMSPQTRAQMESMYMPENAPKAWRATVSRGMAAVPVAAPANNNPKPATRADRKRNARDRELTREQARHGKLKPAAPTAEDGTVNWADFIDPKHDHLIEENLPLDRNDLTAEEYLNTPRTAPRR